MRPDRCEVLIGDVRERLASLAPESVDCVVTSPPYWGLRDYGVPGQLGLESSPAEYVAAMVDVFRLVRRALSSTGTLWLNLGDTYANDSKWGGKTGGKHAMGMHGATSAGRGKTRAGLPPKCLVGIPWRVALALVDDGWTLRADIIWSKPNAMPEPVRDRPTRAHEHLFLLVKSESYHYDADAIREPFANGPSGASPWGNNERTRDRGGRTDGFTSGTGTGWKPSTTGRNARDVWSIPTAPFPGAHFATFPRALVEPCVKAGCPVDGLVLDPFAGSGTSLEVALKLGRRALGIELNPDYLPLIERRLRGLQYPLIAPTHGAA